MVLKLDSDTAPQLDSATRLANNAGPVLVDIVLYWCEIEKQICS